LSIGPLWQEKQPAPRPPPVAGVKNSLAPRSWGSVSARSSPLLTEATPRPAVASGRALNRALGDAGTELCESTDGYPDLRLTQVDCA